MRLQSFHLLFRSLFAQTYTLLTVRCRCVLSCTLYRSFQTGVLQVALKTSTINQCNILPHPSQFKNIMSPTPTRQKHVITPQKRHTLQQRHEWHYPEQTLPS